MNKNQENRENWLRSTLAALPSRSSILDAGAGELQYKRFCDHLQYTSQDFGQYDGTGDHVGLQTKNWDNSKLDIVSDITNIPVENDSFDAIMCVEVFEHLPYPVKAVSEFSRILKKGGKLILTAPFCSMTHFSPYFYHTGFSRYWYEKILADHGFEINDMQYNGNYFTYLRQEVERLPLMMDRYSQEKKPINIINKLARRIMLRQLDEQITNDNGSNEVMCFGINILATKK